MGRIGLATSTPNQWFEPCWLDWKTASEQEWDHLYEAWVS